MAIVAHLDRHMLAVNLHLNAFGDWHRSLANTRLFGWCVGVPNRSTSLCNCGKANGGPVLPLRRQQLLPARKCAAVECVGYHGYQAPHCMWVCAVNEVRLHSVMQVLVKLEEHLVFVGNTLRFRALLGHAPTEQPCIPDTTCTCHYTLPLEQLEQLER